MSRNEGCWEYSWRFSEEPLNTMDEPPLFLEIFSQKFLKFTKLYQFFFSKLVQSFSKFMQHNPNFDQN